MTKREIAKEAQDYQPSWSFSFGGPGRITARPLDVLMHTHRLTVEDTPVKVQSDAA